ncbi:MAG TPA: hypothetical protein VG603_04500 [Chitinophagales bacterium]|nr:hypothetical protein [Chitinophagales bacterium]
METKDYSCTISVNTIPEKALESINHVGDWWTKSFEGSAQKLNDIFSVRFGDTYVNFKVVETLPGIKAVWEVTDSYIPWLKDKNEWTGTKVIWDILPDGSATKIIMTHQGLLPGIECYSECEKGWNFYTGKSLHQLITRGTGLPDTPQSAR